MKNNTDHDLIIIGGGPAGLSAGLYAAREMINVTLLEKGATGGQTITTEWIDNYPGFPEGVSGFDLADLMTKQATRFGLNIQYATVTKMDLKEEIKTIHLENGTSLTCKAVIINTGARPNTINIPGEKELTGQGVSYCATCDAPFYRNKTVAVIGGGNTAVQEAIHLTKFASKVYIIHRRDSLRASKILAEKARANGQIEFLWNTIGLEIVGDKTGVIGLKIENIANKEKRTLDLDGVFVLIGVSPNAEALPLDHLANNNGFLITDLEMRTSIPGVFAAGDIVNKNVRQVVNAAGEGAVACLSAGHYIEEL